MNNLSGYSNRSGRSRFSFQVLFAAIFLALSTAALAQQPQLSLADLLIGLRSKKVTLDERNTILAEAVRQRGVTFSLSTDIEKELRVTGASNVLIDAVRQRSAVAAVPKATPVPVPAATPIPTPTPPDFNFYKTRADVSLNKGEFTLALADYDKAVSLKSDSSIAYLNRGRTHLNLKDFTRAGADFERSIELDPKDAAAFLNRGMLNESLGNLDKAAADYQKAAELDPANEAAKAGLKKVRGEIAAKTAPAPENVKPAVPVKAPESVRIGNLAENAVKLVKPVYSPLAQKANIEGKVVVEVELDEKGNVSDAKAVSGHQFLRGAAEDAAKRSKFKPAQFDAKPIKSTGTITYNFSLKGDE